MLSVAACSSATPGNGEGKPVWQPGSPEEIAAAVIARQTGRATNDVQIVSVEAMQFSDSSLGCPQPGTAYMQVITPGHKVMALIGKQQFDVRVTAGRGIVCNEGLHPANTGSAE